MAAHKIEREEVTIIGGGRGGVETALMLARQTVRDKNTGNETPKYHITLIEAQNSLLNGASLIASRLHLGGEYPLDTQTAQDCLEGALMFKLLMPANVYTNVPPMKFLVAEETQKHGEKPESTEDEKSLTMAKYEAAYKVIEHNYSLAVTQLKAKLHLQSNTEAEKLLFGPKSELFQKIPSGADDGYADYNKGDTKIAGGFQSKEPGINVGKFLATLQMELEREQEKGNITILTGHKVSKDGIKGQLGKFEVHCNKNGSEIIIPSSQVIVTAWKDGPEIIPHLGEDEKGREKQVTVFKRAMLLVDLPAGWKTPPAFIMLGKHGGMLSPYNDKTAICYLPIQEAAYRKNYTLTDSQPSLPADWDKITPEEKGNWAQRYFELLKERFPVLQDASNPRLIVRDTLSFQPDIDQRQYEAVSEVRSGKRMAMKQIANQGMEQEQEQQLQQAMLLERGDHLPPSEVVGRPGLFTLYPTKATYATRSAVQATEMVMERSSQRNMETIIIPPEHPLNCILNNMGKYSLAKMQEPKPLFMQRFAKQHPDLFGESQDMKITQDSWPGKSRQLS